MKILMMMLAIAVALPAAAERYTQKCNPDFGNGEILFTGSGLNGLARLVADPQLNPELYQALWQPKAAKVLKFTIFDDMLILSYDRIQDTGEIASSINRLGIGRAQPNSQVCFATPAPPVPATVTEYFQSALNHYFLSSSEEENAFLDQGGAGGWLRTGETFQTVKPDACTNNPPVFRFYNTVANTHFFTVDSSECGYIRRIDPGWFHEGEAFSASMPVSGTCFAGYTAVYRLYNNRAQFRDANHRFTTRTAIVDDMVARGWLLEGVAMCLPPAQ